MFSGPHSFYSHFKHFSGSLSGSFGLEKLPEVQKGAELCPDTQNSILITTKQLRFYHHELTEAVSIYTLSQLVSRLFKKINEMNLEKGIASSKHINLKHLGYLRNPRLP